MDQELAEEVQEVDTEFLELHLHQDPTGVEDLETDNARVILIYQDVLTCGICNKQYVELSDFLFHKSQHTIGQTCYYKCEICKVVTDSSEVLLKHYEVKHQVPLTGEDHMLLSPGDINQRNAADGSQDEGTVVLETVQSEALASESAVDTQESLNDANADLEGRVQVTDNGIAVYQNGSSVPTIRKRKQRSGFGRQKMASRWAMKNQKSRQESIKSNLELTNNNVSKDVGDFAFILMTETVKGSSFTYGRTWFKCLHCKFKTAGKLCMIRHMKDKHSDELEIHQNLEVKDTGQDENHKVMRMSTYEATYIREKRFRRRQTRRPVLETHDVVGRFACDKCSKVFTRQRYLRKHMEIHRTEKKFLCDVCNKSFKSQTYLTVHKKVHKVKMFKCNQCDFTSNVNAAIHAHRQVHSQGSVLCDICGYAYTDKATLTKHKRVHDVARPYPCTYPGCTWRFKTEIMCRAHFRAHTSEGQFKCSQCGYAFRQKHHLQRHETKIHGIVHSKTSRSQPTSTKTHDTTDMADCTDIVDTVTDTVHLVVNSDPDLQFNENELVVTAPITLEADLSSLNVTYHALLQSHGKNAESQTILLTQPDSHIVFKQ